MGDKRFDIYTWSQQNAWTTDHNLSNDTKCSSVGIQINFAFLARVKHCGKMIKNMLNMDFLSLVIVI